MYYRNYFAAVVVFFSSPFGGMEAEREILTHVYFPELRALCDAAGLAFVPVDLRWGAFAGLSLYVFGRNNLVASIFSFGLFPIWQVSPPTMPAMRLCSSCASARLRAPTSLVRAVCRRCWQWFWLLTHGSSWFLRPAVRLARTGRRLAEAELRRGLEG